MAIKMGRKSNDTKILAMLAGIIGIFAVFSFFIEESLGAWWQVEIDYVIGKTTNYYNAFGMSSGEDSELALEMLGLVAGIIYVLGSVFIIYAASKETKGIGILSALMMVGGLALFCYALANNETLEGITDFLNFISGSDEYNVFFGEWTIYSWRLGNGFFIGTVGAIIGLIGAAKIP
jgi:choline-glycine betaine transporter